MIKSLENILKHKNSATYEEYKNVISEIEDKMFPDLTYKLKRKRLKMEQKHILIKLIY